MTYTRSWRVVVSGNRPKNQMDDAEREIRVDFAERIADVIGTDADWTADPVDDGLTAFRAHLHWSNFLRVGGVFGNVTSLDTLYTYGLRTMTGTTVTLSGKFTLPRECNLVDVEVACVTVVNTTIAVTVYKVDAITGTVARTQLATRSLTGVNAQGNYSVSSGALINDTVGSEDQFYFAEVVITNSSGGTANFGFQGLTLKYTRKVLAYV